MLYRLLTAGLCALAFSACPTNAKAVLITSNGDFALVSDQDPVPPISDIEIIGGSGATGRIYTNQYSGSSPFALGAEIRTVSAYRVDAATDGFQHSGVEFADGDKLVIVSAIRGFVTDTGMGGIVTATFDAGRAFAIKIPAAGFDSRNPETFLLGTIVAEYVLIPQEAVAPGPFGANVAFAAGQTNQSSVNSLTPQQTQGVFLFNEDSQPGQIPGDNLLSNVDQPGGIFLSESLIADIDQTLLFTDLEDFETGANPGGLNAADLAALNFFSMAAGIGEFASGLGAGPVTSFNPQFPPPAGDGPTGDFFATLGADNYVAAQVIVPEPTSLVLLTVGLCAGGLVYLRRQRKGDLDA